MSLFQAIYLVHGLAGYRGLSAQRLGGLGAQLLVRLEFLGRSCPARLSITVERPSPL